MRGRLEFGSAGTWGGVTLVAGQPGCVHLRAQPAADLSITNDERCAIAEMMAKGS
jgi:hypothetical protein